MNLIDDKKREEIKLAKMFDEMHILFDSIELFPNNSSPLMRRAKIYQLNEREDLALIDFMTASKLLPNDENITLELAKSYFENNKMTESSALVKKMMALKNIPIEAYLLRANLNYAGKKYEDAAKDLIKYSELKGADIAFYLLRAKINFLLNNDDKALDDIKQYESLSGTKQELLRKQFCKD
jgi:predicted Zn-dependent protease